MMKTIIYDCDNTMGIPQRDIDDGLTILYLVGSPEVNLQGITTTFGNGGVDMVYSATRQLLEDVAATDIPLWKGGTPERRDSAASEFMVDAVNAHPGKITILATGALTNLYGARLLDASFFRKVRDIVVMGGLTHPLVIGGEKMAELNFSCDPEAAYAVLNSGADTTVITGHLCLQALFGPAEIERLGCCPSCGITAYILERIIPWAGFMKDVFGLDGFYNWDMVAAVYATSPDLFDTHTRIVQSTVEDLRTGRIRISEEQETGSPVHIPTAIRDISRFNDCVFNAWECGSFRRND